MSKSVAGQILFGVVIGLAATAAPGGKPAKSADPARLAKMCQVLAASESMQQPAEQRRAGGRAGLGKKQDKALRQQCCSTPGMPCPAGGG